MPFLLSRKAWRTLKKIWWIIAITIFLFLLSIEKVETGNMAVSGGSFTPPTSAIGILEVEKIDRLLETYQSPIMLGTLIDACKKNKEACKMAIAICYAESKLGTRYARKIESTYHNCGGIKSPRIIQTGRPDSNGSWLRKFENWDAYFAFATDRLQRGYFESDCRKPECIVRYYVGSYSKQWIRNVYFILNKLQ